jgi:hypothetical protein
MLGKRVEVPPRTQFPRILACFSVLVVGRARLRWVALPALGSGVGGMTTTPVVTAVVPPTGPGRPTSHRQPIRGTSGRILPLAALAPARVVSAVYGVAAVDRDGRVADAAVIGALGWVPGPRLDIRESRGLILVEGVWGASSG